ncbi:hypothetical protein [Leptolyngbya sp. NIES-2104]|uniref:hypothetical protein n=1 Tax=Leptolyngbya sp. NIES-2104 TaxID=1552121 RepID=UPI00073ED6C1|nr:hypothetical protein [Leptolyngbya sp. NIES-2104]
MNPRLKRQLQRNKFNIGLLVVAAIATIASKDNIATNVQQMGQLRNQMQSNTAQQMDLLASEDDKAEKEKIAIARYQRGCLFVVAVKDPSKFAALQEDQPVRDRTTGFPLPAGTTVCDEGGNTGEIVRDATTRTPVVKHLAFTGNREVVEAAIKRAGASQVKRTKPNQR